MEQEQLIDLLVGAIQSVDPKEMQLVQRIKLARASPLDETLRLLSNAEHTTTQAVMVRLIATAKAVLRGRRPAAEFVQLCDKVTGLG